MSGECSGLSFSMPAWLIVLSRIPFERALDFANKEKITEKLYPLFVHNIGGLLYHPTNERGTAALTSASDRRRADSNAPRPPTATQPPSLHHHHSMMNPVGPQGTQTPHSIAPHPGSGRPGIDRAHTMPTPPASASSVIGTGNQGSSYEWGGQSIANTVPGTQSLSIDTSISNTRSMPNTPATTPPGNNMQSITPYQGQQHFDSQKYYSGPPAPQASYAMQPTMSQQNMARFGQPMQSSYAKSDMGPPSLRGNGTGTDGDPHDIKPEQYSQAAGSNHVAHSTANGDNDDDHENDYMNTNNTSYNTARSSYTYGTAANVNPLHSDPSHVSPEINGSPHQDGSGRGTPRTTGTTQPQWGSTGYNTPPRSTTSSNLYNVMSDPRGSGVNGTSGDSYAASSYSTSINSLSAPTKRSRDDDDNDSGTRPGSQGLESGFDLKRRRTDSANPPVGGLSAVQSIKAGGGIPRVRR